MRRVLLCGLLLMSVLFVAGCGGDSHEKVSQDMVKVMEDYGKVLADVKDEKSAKAAGAKLEKLAGRISDINARLEELGDPDEAAEKAIREKHQPEFDEARKEIERNVMRIAMLGPAVTEELDKSMDKMHEALVQSPH